MKRKEPFVKRLIIKLVPEIKGDVKITREDLKRSNDLAVDIGKLLITLSTFIITLSVSLQKTIAIKHMVYVGWFFEVLSIFIGVIFLYSIFRIYRYWSKVSTLDLLAFIFGLLQFILFFVGLILIALSTF
jgi:hypothetical protein